MSLPYRYSFNDASSIALFWSQGRPFPKAQTTGSIAPTVTVNGSISGNALTLASAQALAIGQSVTGSGVTAGTVITGGSGTAWTVNTSQTVTTTALTFPALLTVASGAGIAAGQSVAGAGVALNTTVTGGAGTYWSINNSQTVALTTLSFGAGQYPVLTEPQKTSAGVLTPAYVTVGENSRLRCSSIATEVEIDVINESGSGPNAHFAILYQGKILQLGEPKPGFSTLRALIPHQATGPKAFEIVTPFQFAAARGGRPSGVYVTEVRANAPITFTPPTAPGTFTRRIVVLCDSIASGAVSKYAALMGMVGIAQRGLQIKSLTAAQGYKGAYNGATAYAKGDWVLQTGIIWRSLATQTGVAPGLGVASWTVDGVDALVTIYDGWGTKTIADDWESAAKQTEHAAFIAAMQPTIVLDMLGSNDQALNGVTGQPQLSLAGLLAIDLAKIDAIHAAAPTAAYFKVKPFLRPNVAGGPEIANGQGWSLPDMRSGQSAFTTGRAWLTLLDGLAALVAADFGEVPHPNSAGQRKASDWLWPQVVTV